jgi:hypothetical protein
MQLEIAIPSGSAGVVPPKRRTPVAGLGPTRRDRRAEDDEARALAADLRALAAAGLIELRSDGAGDLRAEPAGDAGGLRSAG